MKIIVISFSSCMCNSLSFLFFTYSVGYHPVKKWNIFHDIKRKKKTISCPVLSQRYINQHIHLHIWSENKITAAIKLTSTTKKTNRINICSILNYKINDKTKPPSIIEDPSTLEDPPILEDPSKVLT